LPDHLLKTFVQEHKTILAVHSVPPEEKFRFFFNQHIELIHRAMEAVIFFDFWV
jgi:hypothetical protein